MQQFFAGRVNSAYASCVTEGEALPLTRSSEHSWQGAFAGEGGSIVCTVTVPKTDRGAVQSEAEVGSREASTVQ